MKKLRYILFLLSLHFSHLATAQLDTIHWLPTMHARGEDGPHYLYLSTPEITPFQVTVRDGSGSLVTQAQISNTQPFVYNLGTGSNTKIMIPQSDLHVPISAKGLIIDGVKPFYAYFRVHSTSQFQAGDLTCKGRAALGTTFRLGHLLQGFVSTAQRMNFVSIMATEDSTVVNMSEFEQGTKFRVQSLNTLLPSPVTIVLNKGQTCVLAQYSGAVLNENTTNGFMGSLLTATKPIAVNVGSWTGAPVNYSSNDIGIDQIVPIELVGDEYILCRGNGSEILERPMVVAHYNDTKVFINGSVTPITTLNAGEWIALETILYTSGGNMHILTSQPAYVYQMVGGIATGNDQSRTAGLIFVPPVSCGIPNAVDNIYLPNLIGSMDFDGGMMITAMRDSLVTLRVDGVIRPTGAASAVLGNPDFVTYRPLNLFSQGQNPKLVSVRAQGAVQVALFGRNEPASFAGFFSGFTIIERPKLNLSLVGDGVCPDTLIATGKFDGVQWMFADSIIQFGPDSILIAYAPGQYSARGYLGVCRRSNYAADTILASFNSPIFPFASQDPSCYEGNNGTITFGTPSGGIAPYRFSVDKGQTFTNSQTITGLGAAQYDLVVQDSTGCYNAPLQLTLGQPDRFGVVITPVQVPDPLFPGQLAQFLATTDRPISASQWTPNTTIPCIDCMNYDWIADNSRWIEVTVYDTAGCPATARIYVEVMPNVYAPNVFQPQSNTGNETFTLFSKEELAIKRLRIYDRWGDLVFDRLDITTNDLSTGWNGTDRNGRLFNPAVFVWVAEVERLPGKIATLYGDVTLIRE